MAEQIFRVAGRTFAYDPETKRLRSMNALAVRDGDKAVNVVDVDMDAPPVQLAMVSDLTPEKAQQMADGMAWAERFQHAADELMQRLGVMFDAVEAQQKK